MEVKKSKPHGMTSDKAYRVKTRGNRKEDIFARVIDGIVIKGTKKQDVMSAYEQFFSIKGSSEKKGGEGRDGRLQVFMYNPSRFEKEKDFPAGLIIKDIFACYPPTHQEYQEQKKEIKEKIAEQMIRLKEFLLDDNNRSKFLDRAFFDRKVDFLVIYDDEIFHVFDKEEVWDVFLKYLNVENNATNQKVVFKYKYLCMEIEMRTTDDGKYPTIFMPMNKRINFNLLVEKIKEKIENELKDCPQSMCKQIINTIKNKEVFFFEEKTLETIVQRIKDIEKNNIYGIFISITAKAQKDINKVSETLQKISDILKGKKINLGAGMKGNDHDKILLFVSYNKKEDKNEKED